VLTRDSEGHAQCVKTGVLSIPKWFKKEVDLPEALTGWKRPGGRPEEEESVKTKQEESRRLAPCRALGQRTMISGRSVKASSD